MVVSLLIVYSEGVKELIVTVAPFIQPVKGENFEPSFRFGILYEKNGDRI